MATRLVGFLAGVLLTLTVLLPATSAGTLGTYGAIAGSTTTGLAGKYTGTLTGTIVYQDTGATADTLDSTEAVFLSFADSAAVDQNEIQLSAVGPGSAGGLVTTPISSSIKTLTGGTALNSLLRFKDTLPAYAEGGPDGKFNPGEILFLDVDKDGTLSANDLILSGGTPGSRSTVDTDTIWHGSSECIYQGTGSSVAVGLRRVTGCGVYAAGTPTEAGQADVLAAAALTAISGIVISSVAPRTVTDGVTTTASTTVTSATAAFTAGDIHRAISGGSIPAGAYIVSVTDGSTVEISAAVTTGGTSVSLTIGSASIMEPTEGAWFGSGAVASGHYRLTGTTGVVDCVVGASHAADSDCATSTTSVSNTLITRNNAATYPSLSFPGIAWLDMNGDASRGPLDRIYADVDADSYVGPADIRLNTGSSAVFGSRPMLGDLDTRAVLRSTAYNAAVPIYQDTDGDGILDSTEPVALSLDGDAHFDFGDVPLVTVGTCTAGVLRLGATSCGASSSGTWKSASTPAMVLCYYDQGTAGATRGDSLYVHLGTCTGSPASGDIRVTQLVSGGTSSAGGTRLTASDGATLSAVTLGTTFTIRLYDADGSGTATSADLPYLESGAGNNLAGVNDARLHGLSSLAFGAFLSETISTDKDTVLQFIDVGTDPTFAYFDLDSSPGRSLGDAIYMRVPGASCGTLTAVDTRVSAGRSSLPAGQNVGGSIELGNSCADVGGAKLSFWPTSAPYSSSSTIILDLGADGLASIGDVRIGGSAPGAKIISGNPEINGALTEIALSKIKFLDSNGNGALESNEPIVIDFDGDGVYSSGDALLTGTGGTTTLGGTTTPATPPPASTSQTSSASSSSSATTSSSSSTSSGPAVDIAVANQNLRSSMLVTRDGTSNTILWSEQTGVAGYQIWGSESPFVLLATINDASTSSYVDANAAANRAYLVTAFLPGGELTADQVNAGTAPGYSESPTGSSAPTSSQSSTSSSAGKKPGFIPGPSLVTVLGAVAVALVLVRRKL